MKKLTGTDVLRECNGNLFFGNADCELARFSKDTRTIMKGDTYLGIQGDNFDGNLFYQKAFDLGASTCILDHFDESSFDAEKYFDKTIILVKDTLKSIQKLATYKRSLVNIPVIAVTGSVGKTSTKDMIASVLKTKYKVLSSIGNLNGQLGLPLNILRLEDEEVMVLEMGMNEAGQIETLTNIAKPTIGVITNIGTAHIGILGSRENILKAKLEILSGMPKGSSLVINYDNDKLHDLSLSDINIITCGIREKSQFQASHVEIFENRTTFKVDDKISTYDVSIPAMGFAFVENSLLSIAVGRLLSLSEEEIQKGLKTFTLSSNRMEMISLKDDILIINDAYNANYEAIVSALDTLIRLHGSRRIAVLGDVLEMEDYAKSIHYNIGQIEFLKKVDAIFLNGESAKYIQDGAIANGISKENIFYFSKKEDLEKSLISFLRPDDTLLIKASNGMHFGEIVDKIKESFL